MIYLGLTNDNNPLYIQNEYAQKLGHAGPVVPPVLLSGIMLLLNLGAIPYLSYTNALSLVTSHPYITLGLLLELIILII